MTATPFSNTSWSIGRDMRAARGWSIADARIMRTPMVQVRIVQPEKRSGSASASGGRRHVAKLSFG
jgi:hypothetical protein